MARVLCFSEQTGLLLKELFAQRSPCAHRPARASFRDFPSTFSSPLSKFFIVPTSRYTEKASERTVPSCEIRGAAGGRGGDTDYIQPFFFFLTA